MPTFLQPLSQLCPLLSQLFTVVSDFYDLSFQDEAGFNGHNCLKKCYEDGKLINVTLIMDLN